MKHSFLKISLGALFFIAVKPFSLSAQETSDHDESYYVTPRNAIIPRLYFSKKNTSFTLPALQNAKDLKYRANNRTNMGIGIIYKEFSLNVGYDFDFLNPTDKPEKGDTKGYNMQFHIYPRKWVIDAVGIFQEGNYLSTTENIPGKVNDYIHRPDVNQDIVNLAAYRISNSKRFSYRAAMVNNEWQKKSAGSLLYGGQAYYGSMRGDSALVPKALNSKFSQAGIDKINYFSAGPGIGYAYTLVMGDNFFIMGSLIANVNLNFSTEHLSNEKNKKVGVSPAGIYKASVGYNSSTWSLTANYAGNAYWMQGKSSSEHYFIPADNFRIVLAKKFERNK